MKKITQFMLSMMLLTSAGAYAADVKNEDQGPKLSDVGMAETASAPAQEVKAEEAKAPSSPVVGVWKTIDDKAKKAKSYVEIYEKDGKLFGKVTELLLKPADTVCKKCKHNYDIKALSKAYIGNIGGK